MTKYRTLKIKAFYAVFFLCCLIPLKGWGQNGESAVDVLVEMGFENVGWTEDDNERVYVLQNSAYRLNGVGIGKAVDVIQKLGLPENKSCRIIVLDNNVPQISLRYYPIIGDSVPMIERRDWNVSYDLGDSWSKVRKVKLKNRSLFKVDIVVFPELMFQNYKISRVYDIVLNVSPAISVSLWKGMKVTGQVIFPIVNDYGARYEQIRPGFVTVSQTVRLPKRTFLTGTIGFFNNFRWGVDVYAKHIFIDQRFWVDARLGYTGRGYFDNWAFYHGVKWTLTGTLSANFFLPRWNTQFTVRGDRYLLKEYGIRADMVRHFRYASIGFYAMKVFGRDDAANKGLNGGFLFQIALPPYKYKRKGYIPRVVGGDFGIRYNAGNEKQYGDGYRTNPDDNVMRNNSFNPYFIKNELLNF
ncbi:hypothetical protein [Mediterranea massiliensis]|uniref:hypothetical protein n=1 Tax=Mediterranea massiliensis TaxID=1841865 RepID=UPI0025A41410|nr:hypothetical protein [Mediterranea massiliensis]MDM8338248.1 hypothetical protein [Mediterranea massiliensis]